MRINLWGPHFARFGRRRSRLLLGLTVFMILLAWAVTPVQAQQITGSIAGTVKDEQGAAITTAGLKAIKAETGLTRVATADSTGVYNIQYLPIGHYTVEVEAPGFTKFVQENLVLTVNQTVTLNVALAIGTEIQTITVTEAPPLVETSTAELGRTIEPSEIIGLPLVNRNAYAELSLTPGVQSNPAIVTSTMDFYGTSISVNGGCSSLAARPPMHLTSSALATPPPPSLQETTERSLRPPAPGRFR